MLFGKKTRLVVADYHASIREMLAETLPRRGAYEVVGLASTGMEALRLCGRHRPDVLVVSLMLNELSGPEVLRNLGRYSPDTKALIFSGAVDESLLLAAACQLPEGFVHKNDSLATLLEALQVVTKGGVYHSALIDPRTSPAGGTAVGMPSKIDKVRAAAKIAVVASSNGGACRRTSVAGENVPPPGTEALAEPIPPALTDDGANAASRGAVVDAFQAAGLTHRERDVVLLVAEGSSSKQIGDCLALSVRTVENYRSTIMRKLGVKNATELVRHAVAIGLVTPRRGGTAG